MTDLCNICEEALGELPTTTLLCHHTCHTQCFLENMANAHPTQLFFLQCVSCNQHVFPQPQYEEEENEGQDQQLEEELDEQEMEEAIANEQASVDSWDSERDRVSNLWDTNADFRLLITKYKQAVRASAQPRRAFTQLIRTKKTELAPLYTQIKAQVEGNYNVKKDQIMQSNEYKNYRKVQARYNRYWHILRETYHLRRSSLYGLRNKPGCKSLHWPRNYLNSPHYMVRRALRLRLKF